MLDFRGRNECTDDWRYGSDGQVLDLIHPSLFPLIYGHSRVLLLLLLLLVIGGDNTKVSISEPY